MSRVFICHDDGFLDFTDAERFGETHAVVTRDRDSEELYPDNASDLVPNVMVNIRRALQDFNPETDYLCLAGSPIIQAMCLYVLGQRRFPVGKHLRILRYSKREQAYFPVII